MEDCFLIPLLLFVCFALDLVKNLQFGRYADRIGQTSFKISNFRALPEAQRKALQGGEGFFAPLPREDGTTYIPEPAIDRESITCIILKAIQNIEARLAALES